MGGMPLVSDLRTGNMVGGCAELALMNAAAAQMCHFYGLPIYNSCGLTESKLPDAQAGFEKGPDHGGHGAGRRRSTITTPPAC